VQLRSDRRFRIPLEPAGLWARIADLDGYRRWWPWLRELDADALAVGDQWRCTVRPPLPYVVRFTITIDDLVPAERIDVTVRGDISGTATLHIRPAPGGCEARLISALTPDHRALRLLTFAAGPMVRFGHDWVLDSGARQFIERAV
jgi:uncharacterized protein YndB with AHSA1/START domain